MKFLRKAVVAAIACSWLFLSGCGGTYRPIASILPLQPGNPQLADTVAVFNVNPCTLNLVNSVNVNPCAVPNPTVTPTGSLSVFNVSGDSNVGNFPIGANDTLAASPPLVNPLTSRLITFAGGNSFIAAANPQSDTVTLINILENTATLISLPTGFVPSFITATATTGQILVSLQLMATAPNGSCAGMGAIGIIDTATAALSVSPICAGSAPGFILVAQNDTEAFILDQKDPANNVRVLNLATLTSSSKTSMVGTVGTAPIWATTSVDGNTIYVLNQGSNSISAVDAVGQTVTNPSIASASLSSPSVIVTDADLNRLYISNTGNNTVTVLDASSPALTILHTVAVGTSPIALAVIPKGKAVAPNVNQVYVANTGTNTVSVINANSFNITTLMPDPAATVQSVAVSNDGTKAFIAVTVPNDKANANQTSGNGIYVVLTSNNRLVTNASGGPLNIAPAQDLTCDVTESCFVSGVGSVPLQRPMQIVPRI